MKIHFIDMIISIRFRKKKHKTLDAYLLSVDVPAEHHARFGRRGSALDVHKIAIPIALSYVEQLQAALGQHWWRDNSLV